MSVRIEFTEKTEKRQEGEQVVVDENSAKHFVEDAKVAKYLDVDEPEPAVEPAPAAAPSQPADPPPVETVDGEVVEPGEVAAAEHHEAAAVAEVDTKPAARKPTAKTSSTKGSTAKKRA